MLSNHDTTRNFRKSEHLEFLDGCVANPSEEQVPWSEFESFESRGHFIVIVAKVLSLISTSECSRVLAFG
jgi:hypothetical protein